jgi:hypothetical protein
LKELIKMITLDLLHEGTGPTSRTRLAGTVLTYLQRVAVARDLLPRFQPSEQDRLFHITLWELVIRGLIEREQVDIPSAGKSYYGFRATSLGNSLFERNYRRFLTGVFTLSDFADKEA